ncbi:sporulation protein YtxC [Thalassobacillus devorans]|uniref:sporulation protein YtxC n=1 Tax=Thalassobacillus devorans TaxID=279813 RepID=UPI000490D5E8|nr:sporulation protein YtxC [Thalassobacillus devorans]
MIRFFFISRQETITFCDAIMQEGAKFQVQWKGDDQGGNQVSLIGEEWGEGEKDILVNILSALVFKYRLPLWQNQLIRQKFYYQDEEEIHRIREICDWLNDTKQRKKLGVRLPSLEDRIQTFVRNRIQFKSVVNFNEMMPFCFQHVRTLLLSYIGAALDEFKREEDYLLWVESLRHYMQDKPSKVDELYLLQQSQLHYYSNEGKLLSKTEIKALLKKEPIRIFSGGIDDHSITTALVYAPKRIYVYGDPAEPKIQTIINIFQERVICKPVHAFPFHHPAHIH